MQEATITNSSCICHVAPREPEIATHLQVETKVITAGSTLEKYRNVTYERFQATVLQRAECKAGVYHSEILEVEMWGQQF
jgi:hypothetical protein